MSAADFVLVGYIEGAFGVHGEARVRSFTAPPENITTYGPLSDAQGVVRFRPSKWRPIGEALAMTAPEIKSREDAMALRGTQLFVSRAKFPAPDDEDEFYVVDLIGCRAETLTCEDAGKVIAVHDFGAGELLEIKPPSGAPYFLEFTRANVPHVALAERRLTIDPPPVEEAGDAREEDGA